MSRGAHAVLARALLAAVLSTALAAAAPAAAQDVGREAALALEFEPLEFRPPEPVEHELSGGVEVLHMEDHTLPLVTVYARFRGGFANFGREHYAAATSLPSLIRGGGTTTLPPDSVDALMDGYAFGATFGTGGGSSFASLNMLTDQLDAGLRLLGDLLRDPGFDSARVEVWRGQELENVRRRSDDPGRLAVGEFNRLMFGDHPIGWEMEPSDLEPEDLSRERLEHVHRRVFCPANLTLGVAGDVSWEVIAPLLERLLEGWAACPEPLTPATVPVMRSEPGVFLIPRPLEQSTVVMAHAAGVRQGDSEAFYASRIGNSILGAGGFSSRLMARLRTEHGYAYSASSLWTAPARYDGLVGAVTRTRSESTVAAIRLVLRTVGEMTEVAPSGDEVRRTIDEIVNGFVFNFESPEQILSRRMAYLAQGMPADWLERYLEGIQEVSPEDVREVFAEEVDPARMIILVLGNPDTFDEPLEALGPVTLVDPDAPAGASTGGTDRGADASTSARGAARRSLR